MPPQDGNDGVVDIGDGNHGGNHGSGVALGSGSCPAQGLVFLIENLQADLFVVEDLHHLLAVDHLLDIPARSPRQACCLV